MSVYRNWYLSAVREAIEITTKPVPQRSLWMGRQRANEVEARAHAAQGVPGGPSKPPSAACARASSCLDLRRGTPATLFGHRLVVNFSTYCTDRYIPITLLIHHLLLSFSTHCTDRTVYSIHRYT